MTARSRRRKTFPQRCRRTKRRAQLRRAAVRSDRWGPAQQRVLSGRAERSFNQAWQAAQTGEDLHEMIDHCRARLAENPIDTDARCFLAHALARSGEDMAARATMALDKPVWSGELPLPERFRAELAAEIRANPTLAPDPRNKVTRDGLQTARLGLLGEPAVAVLMDKIKTAVERYKAELERCADPFIVHPPATVRMHQWAVIYGATGRQTAHRHATGWLSGVYYVAAPRGPDGYQGALLVGAPETRLATPPPWGVRRIEPVPGRLVLFPSFVTHATEPCGAEGERISVAFDVIPVTDEETAAR